MLEVSEMFTRLLQLFVATSTNPWILLKQLWHLKKLLY